MYVPLGGSPIHFLRPCARENSIILNAVFFFVSAAAYPVANTCQIPFWHNIGDLYSFVFGYKTDGCFVEIGAYDGESFSNTSCLADIGWTGHYLEPIPKYAAACRQRHAGNKNVHVHTVCVGATDGETVTLSTAGPFTSGVADEVATVNASQLGGALKALGWGHAANGAGASSSVTATTVSLDSFIKSAGISAKAGSIDVLVIDVEVRMIWQLLNERW
jgi:hypothetical protein